MLSVLLVVDCITVLFIVVLHHFQGEAFFSEIEKTKYLVIDEADRMIEKGHFEELTMLLERMKRYNR